MQAWKLCKSIKEPVDLEPLKEHSFRTFDIQSLKKLIFRKVHGTSSIILLRHSGLLGGPR